MLKAAVLLLTTVMVAPAYNAEIQRTPGTTTSGGSQIIQGIDAPAWAATVTVEGVYLEEISAHVEKVFGPFDTVIHESVSGFIHVDVLPVPPSDARPYWTLVTVGMSDRAITVPRELTKAKDWDRAELMMVLPADWARDVDDLMSSEKAEPRNALRSMALYPDELQAKLRISADEVHQALRIAGFGDHFLPGRASVVINGKLLGHL